ncbi:iron-containing alcohol dehydrogenase [Elstera cyanobacteriorum]|uniref:iron-containing alcohol dehydrogenase n=1 Tax=Elstera cyanobacteriorum TaxID=2022747 RepID=UPI002357FE03|nr:iron-containing alcohol dehydrogenase [Elstera cyanobacteriorum]MCK6442086.1 iron-containing alcohol dehydrogenase [Elstera cyanobacteriorum]
MFSLMTPQLVVMGGGSRHETVTVLQRLGITRPLIVTDGFLVKTGVVGEIEALLHKAGMAPGRFDETVPDPTVAVVEAGVTRLQEGAYDGLLAIGGGSPMDTAKAMAVLAAGGGAMRDYKVPASADKADLPIVCIPTTAGTGSEVTRFAVITDEATDEKMLIMGLACLPRAAIVDYELTLTKPLRLTADTGIDALTHAIEAFVSKKATPLSDVYALEAMRLIYPNLRTACFEPGNHAAREAMMRGATLAGLAFSNASVALVHGMSRPIGAFFHVPHGLSNAMLLPVVTAFSAPAALDRYATVARTLGLATAAEGDQAAVSALLEALTALNRDLTVPSPAAYGIDEARYRDLMPRMAEQALASGSPGNNPRVPTAAEIVMLYDAAYRG